MRQNIQPEFRGQEELLRAIKANDDAVLKGLYTSNYHKTEKYVIENSGTADDARDVFQEAFLVVWRNIQLDKFFPENETALSGYLFQIAKFKWIDQLRAAKKNRVISIEETGEDWDRELDQVNEHEVFFLQKVKKEFRKLGEACRDILSRFYYRKESLRTIADQAGLTEATARNNKYRCLQKLRALVRASD